MNLGKIHWVGLPKSQYYQSVHPKRQIVLHHTASGRGADGDINWWLQDPYRIATFMIIDHSGVYHQLFNSRYWGHHLGMKNMYNGVRNKQSIAIELDSWGPLAKVGEDNYTSYTGATVHPSQVVYYPNGFGTYPSSHHFNRVGVTGKVCHYYEKYTIEQLNSLRYLLNYLTSTYSIPRHYNEKMWEYNKDAVQGAPGIWTHVSYRKDKTDCHPQAELIDTLKSL